MPEARQGQKRPADVIQEAIYEVAMQKDGQYQVIIRRPSAVVGHVSDFRTEAEAEAWVAAQTEVKLMGWMAPGRHLSAKMVFIEVTNEGAIHERDYNDWAGLGQERFSGPWDR
jgi:hypothetical protein